MTLSPQVKSELAAAYALGTLKGAARRRFESHMAVDSALKALVFDWQLRLQPLNELSYAHNLANNKSAFESAFGNKSIDLALDRVWLGVTQQLKLDDTVPAPVQKLESALDVAHMAQTSHASQLSQVTAETTEPLLKQVSQGGFSASLNAYVSLYKRWIVSVTGAVALVLSAIFAIGVGPGLILADKADTTKLTPNAPVPTPSNTVSPAFFANLAGDDARNRLRVTANADLSTLTLTWLDPQSDQGGAASRAVDISQQSLEVWAIAPPEAGLAPQSLGLMKAANGMSVISVKAALADRLRGQTAVLAISLEPLGGSKKLNSPSGAVILKGAWVTGSLSSVNQSSKQVS